MTTERTADLSDPGTFGRKSGIQTHFDSAEEKGQNDLLRSLMNVHMPRPVSRNFCAYRTNICRQNGTHGVLWTAPVCPPFPEIPASFYGRATSRH